MVSSQSTPSPPPPPPPLPPSTTSVSKPVARADLSEARQHQQDLSRSSESINDQQWYMVGSNRTLRKAAAATTNRREPTDEPQTAVKANRTAPNNAGKNLSRARSIVNMRHDLAPHPPMCMCRRVFRDACLFLNDVVFRIGSFVEHPAVLSMSSSRTHPCAASQAAQPPRRRRGRRPARPSSPTHVPFLTKRASLQSSSPLRLHHRELAFRQLAEQLWAAGLPSATTACSVSVRSRRSSAPASERGAAEDDMCKAQWNNSYDDEDESVIDWDEPDKPDEGNSRRKKSTHICLFVYPCIISNTFTCTDAHACCLYDC